MITILLYIIKVTLCLSVFWVLFRVLFRQTTFFRFNRYLLLLGSVMCLWLPLIELDTEPTYLQFPFQFLERELLGDSQTLSSSAFNSAGTDDGKHTFLLSPALRLTEDTRLSNLTISSGQFKTLLYILYFAGFLFNLYLLVQVILRISGLIRRSKKERIEGYQIAVTPEDIDPCCYGRTILVSEKDYLSPDSMILMHEKMHLCLKHPIDLFYFNLLTLFFWFTPCVWFLLRDLKAIHEFEVDAAILKEGCDAKKYQLLIVKKTVGARRFSLANGFSHISLKTRIDMMLKKPTHPWTKLRVFIFAPIALTIAYAFAGTKPLDEAFVNGSSLSSFVQSEEKETLDQLTEYFSSELRKWTAIPGNSATWQTLEKSPTHTMLINSQNVVLYDKKIVSDPLQNLENLLTNSLCQTYTQQLQEKGKTIPQFLFVQYDQDTDPEMLRNYLARIKTAFMEARSQCKHPDTSLNEDELPVLVQVFTPKASVSATPEDPNKHFSGITVTMGVGTTNKVLTNFTLSELEEALLDQVTKNPNTEISVQVKKDTPQKELVALKDALRKVQQLKLNMKSE